MPEQLSAPALAATSRRAAVQRHAFPAAPAADGPASSAFGPIASALAARIDTRLQPLAAQQLHVLAHPPQPAQARPDWRAAAIARTHTLDLPGAHAATFVDPALVRAVAVLFYGGRAAQPVQGDLTTGELRLALRLALAVADAIDPGPSSPSPRTAATPIQDVSPAALATEPGAMLFPFDLALAGGAPLGTFAVLCGARAMRALADRAGTGRRASGAGWSGALRGALLSAPLPVRSVLGEARLSVPALASLRPGDLIPFRPAADPLLIVGGHALFAGIAGEQRGAAALRLARARPLERRTPNPPSQEQP